MPPASRSAQVAFSSTAFRERGCCFECDGASMVGVLASPVGSAEIGVVIVVGGPQYRIGSHRQFVLLARTLAMANVASLRFDYRGLGDSDGARLGFEHIGRDIRAAVDALYSETASLKGVVLWGLCDGASASALYAPGDSRIVGLALFNPWVRTPASEAEAIIRHYYARRLMSREFWAKLASAQINVRTAIGAFFRITRRAYGTSTRMVPSMHRGATLPERIGDALSRYDGAVLIGLSGNDRVAEEFRLAAARPGNLSDRLHAASVQVLEMPGANHTFSSRRHGDAVARATIEWMRGSFGCSIADTPEHIANTQEWG
jgi:exosortase A-associated hydrolase 1